MLIINFTDASTRSMSKNNVFLLIGFCCLSSRHIRHLVATVLTLLNCTVCMCDLEFRALPECWIWLFVCLSCLFLWFVNGLAKYRPKLAVAVHCVKQQSHPPPYLLCDFSVFLCVFYSLCLFFLFCILYFLLSSFIFYCF